jgi:hypothetical protein
VEADPVAPVEDREQAKRFRFAQANRVIRYLSDVGVDVGELVAGRVRLDLSAIKGPNGWVQPEDIDFAAADRRFNPPGH